MAALSSRALQWWTRQLSGGALAVLAVCLDDSAGGFFRVNATLAQLGFPGTQRKWVEEMGLFSFSSFHRHSCKSERRLSGRRLARRHGRHFGSDSRAQSLSNGQALDRMNTLNFVKRIFFFCFMD